MVTETCTLQGEKNPFGAFWPLAEAGGKAFRLYNKNPTQGSGPRATERSHPDPLLSVSFCGATSCVEVHMCAFVWKCTFVHMCASLAWKQQIKSSIYAYYLQLIESLSTSKEKDIYEYFYLFNVLNSRVTRKSSCRGKHSLTLESVFSSPLKTRSLSTD